MGVVICRRLQLDYLRILASVDDVVREIEALGFPRREVRTLDEPANFEVTGVMSFPRLDFEVDLIRELTRIGATKMEAQDYAEGLRRGGALVFATGSNEKVDDAAEMMNRHGAIEIEEIIGRSRILAAYWREHVSRKRWVLPNRADPASGRRRPLFCVVALKAHPANTIGGETWRKRQEGTADLRCPGGAQREVGGPQPGH